MASWSLSSSHNRSASRSWPRMYQTSSAVWTWSGGSGLPGTAMDRHSVTKSSSALRHVSVARAAPGRPIVAMTKTPKYITLQAKPMPLLPGHPGFRSFFIVRSPARGCGKESR